LELILPYILAINEKSVASPPLSLDTIVFGKIAGSQAARLAKEIVEIEKTRTPSRSVNNNRGFGDGMFIFKEPLKFGDEIQDLMTQYAGIVRDETKLKTGLKGILELKNKLIIEPY